MEKYHFASTLLIPAPKYAGNDFRWIDTLRGETANGNTEKVHVIAFNVKEKGDIKPMLERELQRLQQLDTPEENDMQNIAFIKQTLQEMESGMYEHKAPDALMEAISHCAGSEFKANDVIYLTGVNRISH